MSENKKPSDVQLTTVKWHSLSADETLQKLSVSGNGLSTAEAQQRLQVYGPNRLPEKKAPGLLLVFLRQFKNPLIYVLLAAAIVSMLLQEYTDATFIVAVLLLNALIGTIQEWKAEKSAASLQQLLHIISTLSRDQKKQQLDAQEVVPGDIVWLESGQRVPADLRLLQTHQLKIDEAFLTGESLAIEKQSAALAEDTNLGDRQNMAFAGATVMSGRAKGVVVHTGLQTEVGNIARSVTTAEASKPPLVIRMEKLARQIAFIVLLATVALAIIAFLQGMEINEIFFLAVALAVSAIPEGLPVTITVALSIATNRMAKRNVIVRKLTAVEGLGSCTFIASDKTGTLTVNKQTVKKLSLPDGRQYDIGGEGYNNQGEILKAGFKPLEDTEEAQLQYLSKQAVLCNEAQLQSTSEGWKAQGDAVDIALLAMAHKSGLAVEEVRTETEILKEIPYESENKYAAVFYRENGYTRLAIKGALETLLSMATHMGSAQGPVPLDAEKIKEQASRLSQQGYRVLAIATALIEEGRELNEEGIESLNILALTGLIDPLRPEVKEAVDSCHKAGVHVAVVTGDHPETAFAIAHQLGIAEKAEQVITGRQLEEIDNPESEEFVRLIEGKRVFARVAPLQKMQLVKALIRSGNFVAVTGDGVNDVPALKQANIGVAMGSGTDLAKETAEIIVTDDNFNSIEAGIRGGRFAYDNIRKVTYLLISTGAAELVLFILSLISGLPLPLTAVQLLWLNLVTNGIQDVALAFEGGEEESMNRPPRKPEEGIFNALMIKESLLSGLSIGLIAFGSWYYFFQADFTTLHARSLLLMLMVFMENVHVFNCRSEFRSAFKVPLSRNWFIVGGVLLAQGIHVLAMNLPPMQKVLEVQAVSIHSWFQLFGVALGVLVVMEIFKRFQGSIKKA